jgi:hypothetical protein
MNARSWVDFQEKHLLVEPKFDLLVAMVSDQTILEQLLGYTKVKIPTIQICIADLLFFLPYFIIINGRNP